MHKKIYRAVICILLGIVFIPVSFFFVGCKDKKNENLNPTNADIFQEIASYIKANGKETTLQNPVTGTNDKIFTIKHTNDENSFDYYPEHDVLSIHGYTTDLNGMYFTIYIPHCTEYSQTNYTVDGFMSQFYHFQLTLPNTPRGFKEAKDMPEGHRNIHNYDKYTYEADKKEAVSLKLAEIITSNLKTFSSYFQDKTSVTKTENALLYYFHLPLSIAIQAS